MKFEEVGPSITTITAQRIDQDDPSNTTWEAFSEGTPIYGGSEPSTADNLRLEIFPDPSTVTNITWSFEGNGNAIFSGPPTGPTATKWELGDITDPAPGEITFSVRISHSDGSAQCATFTTEIGVRTDDVIIIGWIVGGTRSRSNAGWRRRSSTGISRTTTG